MKTILHPALAAITLTLAACGTLPTAQEPLPPVSGNNAVMALVDNARSASAGGGPRPRGGGRYRRTRCGTERGRRK